jgi:hypothetical protein
MSMSIAIQPTTRRPLPGLRVAIVREAEHAQSILWVEMETERLMRMHPDSHMSRDQVRRALSRKAVERRIPIAFG